MAGHQLCLAAAILPHSKVSDRPTTGMALTTDDKAEPEPDVAAEHEEADEEDQVDGLVVGGRARLLDLDQGGIVDAVVGVDCLLCLARWRTSCCQLLRLETEHSLPGPAIHVGQKLGSTIPPINREREGSLLYFAMIVRPAAPRNPAALPVEHVVLQKNNYYFCRSILCCRFSITTMILLQSGQ